MTKRLLYRKGLYLMPVPPVCTVMWTESDWINFIDNQGRWLCPKALREG